MDTGTLAFFVGSPGPWEMMLVAIIALLLFGKRLPEVARSLGKGIVEFKKGIRGIEDEVESAVYSADVPSAPSTRPVPSDESEDLTAPKFEPPTSEPADSESATSEVAESEGRTPSDEPATDVEMG